MDKNDLEEMKLHESRTVQLPAPMSGYMKIIRVINGWIYISDNNSSTFVPETLNCHIGGQVFTNDGDR